jgi:Rad3-related DNA helicase/DNA polymerase III epsilon subunit-like protein
MDRALEPIYVALDLETTGLNADRDAIIEVAAVRFSGDRVLGTFETFVQSTVDLPLRVQQITGLAPEDLVGAPEIEGVLTQLVAFVGEDPLVGHSVSHDLRFLARHGATLSQPALDTFELAAILVPEAARYGLGDLVDLLGLDVPEEGRHRALADAHAHRLLFRALWVRAQALPPEVRGMIGRWAGRVVWPLGVVFGGPIPPSPQPPPPKRLGEGETRRVVREENQLEPAIPPSPSLFGGGGQGGGGNHLESLISPGGPLSEQLPDYEDRPGQRMMLRAVADAFDRGDQLLVEAGTGVGKRLAYLIPAAAWAMAQGRPVVVSTHSHALQEQILGQDVPLVRGLLGGDLRACDLKDPSHYLCRARLAGLALREDLDAAMVSAAAKILVWAQTTRTGDRSELLLVGQDERAWGMVNAAADACTPECCPYARAGTCWLQRARAEAEAAHIVVVNHAFMIRDALVDQPSLPPYAHLVIDEAHHLEAVATDALGDSVVQARVREAVAGLAGPQGLPRRIAGAGAGGDSAAIEAGKESGSPPAVPEAAESLVAAMDQAAGQTLAAMDALFHELATFIAEHAGREHVLRLTEGMRRQAGWAAIEAAWDGVQSPLAALRAGLDRLWEIEEARLTVDIHPTDELHAACLADLAVARREIAGIARGLQAVIGRPAADEILWAARGPAQVSLHRAPLFVDEPLVRHVFSGKETLVLTSATLRAGDDFDYLRAQLGLPDAPALVAPSPFDYAASTLLFLPTDMPAPEQPSYRKALNRAIIALAHGLGGRSLVLYTSFTGLKETYHAIRKPLGDAGIVVLGQGMDGSRHTMVRGLAQADRPTILLGASALWENIDVPGPALSGLVITRLPFGVPNDPVFAARSEVFDDAFRDFAVPQAVLRFRQGFGRLNRSAADRGVVVVLDSRVRTKSYGWMFLDALPPCRRFEGPLSALNDVAARWCAGDATVGTTEFAAPSAGRTPPDGGDHDD